ETFEIFVHHALHHGAGFGVEVAEGGAHVLEGAGFDRFGLGTDLGEGSFEGEGVEDDADAADNAGGVGDDLVGAAGDVIGAAGGDVLEGGDDGLFRFLFKFEHLFVHDVGGGDGPAGRIDAEDDGFDARVFRSP